MMHAYFDQHHLNQTQQRLVENQWYYQAFKYILQPSQNMEHQVIAFIVIMSLVLLATISLLIILLCQRATQQKKEYHVVS
jgi:hypothetical protein